MGIFLTILVGLVVGVLAKLALPWRDPGGPAAVIILGVAGAFAAGMLGHGFGWYAAGEGPGIVASLIGAVMLIAIYRAVAGGRSW